MRLRGVCGNLTRGHTLRILGGTGTSKTCRQAGINRNIVGRLTRACAGGMRTFIASYLRPGHKIRPTCTGVIGSCMLTLNKSARGFSELYTALSLGVTLDTVVEHSRMTGGVKNTVNLRLRPRMRTVAFFTSGGGIGHFGGTVDSHMNFSCHEVFVRRICRNIKFAFIGRATGREASLNVRLLTILIRAASFFIFRRMSRSNGARPLRLLPASVFLGTVTGTRSGDVDLTVACMPAVVPPGP